MRSDASNWFFEGLSFERPEARYHVEKITTNWDGGALLQGAAGSSFFFFLKSIYMHLRVQNPM